MKNESRRILFKKRKINDYPQPYHHSLVAEQPFQGVGGKIADNHRVFFRGLAFVFFLLSSFLFTFLFLLSFLLVSA